MESIALPYLADIYKTSKMFIDRPATLAEIMNVKCNPAKMEKTTKILSDVMAKLARHPLIGNTESPPIGPYRLVKDFSTAVLQEVRHGDGHVTVHNGSSFLRFLKNRRMPTVETLDHDMRKELKVEMKTLNDTMRKHQKQIAELQKVQKNYWRNQQKVDLYTHCLRTAEQSRIREGELYPFDHLAALRDKEIARIKQGLKKKAELTDNAAFAYFALSYEVERTQEELSKVAESPPIGPYRLVKDFSTAVLQEVRHGDGHVTVHNGSSFLRFLKNRRMPTVETLDHDMRKELKVEMKTLNDTMRKHQKQIAELQKVQKNYWRNQQKVDLYTHCLRTAEQSRIREGELYPFDHLAALRDKEIARIKQGLKKKAELTDNAAFAYFALSYEVERTQEELSKLSRNMTQKLIVNLMDRVESSLSVLKDLAEKFLPSESRDAFKTRVDDFNAQDFVKAIVSKDLSIYSCPDMKEFIKEHGVCKGVPSGILSSGICA